MSFTISSKSFNAFSLLYVFISAFSIALSRFFIDIVFYPMINKFSFI